MSNVDFELLWAEGGPCVGRRWRLPDGSGRYMYQVPIEGRTLDRYQWSTPILVEPTKPPIEADDTSEVSDAALRYQQLLNEFYRLSKGHADEHMPRALEIKEELAQLASSKLFGRFQHRCGVVCTLKTINAIGVKYGEQRVTWILRSISGSDEAQEIADWVSDINLTLDQTVEMIVNAYPMPRGDAS